MRIYVVILFICIGICFYAISIGNVYAVSTAPIKDVQYDLPYPGILPDNPLYVLKVIRDKFIIFLISDPIKKSQLELLQADKRLNAAVLLHNEHKQNDILVISTASKAENYFNEAIDTASLAKSEGLNIDTLQSRLTLASQKHYEVLRQIENGSSPLLKRSFVSIENRVLILQKMVDALSSNKVHKNN